MKRLLKYVLTALALTLATLPCHAGRFVDDSLKVDGHMRHFAMYLPDGLQKDAPLEFILHMALASGARIPCWLLPTAMALPSVFPRD